MANTSSVDTVIIGAGQAGLSVSCLLKKHGVSHVVLERGRVGHSWRTQRWASFHLNTPNHINVLPDAHRSWDEPGAFGTRDEMVAYLEQYREHHALPVEEGVEVTAVRPLDGGFEVEGSGKTWRCRHVVMCSGDQNHPLTPDAASTVPEDIVQRHAGEYGRPEDLPEGAVLVVGSGQSGVQIVEDLLEAGRRVYLCTSKVGRAPRRYRGKDLVEWLMRTGMAEHRPEDLQDPNEMYARQAQISGTRGGHSVSLHQLAREGTVLLGRFGGVEGRTLEVADDLLVNARVGDESSARLRGGVDMLIEKAGMDAPPAEPDPADEPFAGLSDMARVREVDLDEAGVRSVIWATGFGPNFHYLDPSLIDERGRPRHAGGVCDTPGLYCLGLMWLRRRISGLVAGVAKDAEFVAGEIVKQQRD